MPVAWCAAFCSSTVAWRPDIYTRDVMTGTKEGERKDTRQPAAVHHDRWGVFVGEREDGGGAKVICEKWWWYIAVGEFSLLFVSLLFVLHSSVNCAFSCDSSFFFFLCVYRIVHLTLIIFMDSIRTTDDSQNVWESWLLWDLLTSSICLEIE